MQIKPLGYLPDPPDKRDWIYTGLEPQSSRGDYTIAFDIPVRTQVGSSCVTNAWCNVLEILMVREGISYRRLAEHALYWQVRKYLGWQDQDSGSYIRVGANILASQGVGLAKDWPSDPATLLAKPSSKYWLTAFDSMLAAFYRVPDSDLDAIENAIRAGHPCVTGIQVGQDFMNYSGQSNVVFERPASSLGGHAVTIVGVRGTGDGREWNLLNSWSENWGMNGRCWISSDYLKSASDSWIGTRHPL